MIEMAPRTSTPEQTIDELQAAMAELQARIEAAREREASERQAQLMTDVRTNLETISAYVTSMTDAADGGDVPAIIQGLTDTIMLCQAMRTTLAPTATKPRTGRARGNGGCRAEVLAFMRNAPGVEMTATSLSHDLDGRRSSGHISNELRALADDPQSGVVMTCDAPKKYAFQATVTPDDATNE